jgi:hypothetical protein
MAMSSQAARWRVSVLTIFPEMFPGPLGQSLAGKALEAGLWSLETLDIRQFARSKHASVDDTPFGGGPGMVMRPDVVDAALAAALAEEDEFYQTDLVGLRVEARDGKTLGRVKAVLNFGAGDLLEIEGEGVSLMLPFTRQVVPLVDLPGGRLVADPPAEVEVPR